MSAPIQIDEIFEGFVNKQCVPELQTMLRRRYYGRQYEVLYPLLASDVDGGFTPGMGRNAGLSSVVPWEYFDHTEHLISEFRIDHPNRIARYRVIEDSG